MAWRTVLLGLAGLAASAVLIYFAKPIAILLLSSFGVEDVDSRPPVAQVVTTTGKSFIRKAGHGSFTRLKADRTLFLRDEVKTEKKSRVHLKFNSGYEIEILEESQAILDVWSKRGHNQPEYISFLRGDFRVLQQGSPGQLYIVLEDEVFAPENRPKKNTRNFKISTDNSNTSQSKKTAVENLPETASEPKNIEEIKDLPAKLNTKGSETLSSAYIESQFMRKSAVFRRCQLSSIRDNKMANGNMLFSFVIKPNGRVSQVKVLQNNINNTDLERCVTSVIERTKFKAFNGTAISLSYPLNFQ